MEMLGGGGGGSMHTCMTAKFWICLAAFLLSSDSFQPSHFAGPLKGNSDVRGVCGWHAALHPHAHTPIINEDPQQEALFHSHS